MRASHRERDLPPSSYRLMQGWMDVEDLQEDPPHSPPAMSLLSLFSGSSSDQIPLRTSPSLSIRQWGLYVGRRIDKRMHLSNQQITKGADHDPRRNEGHTKYEPIWNEPERTGTGKGLFELSSRDSVMKLFSGGEESPGSNDGVSSFFFSKESVLGEHGIPALFHPLNSFQNHESRERDPAHSGILLTLFKGRSTIPGRPLIM